MPNFKFQPSYFVFKSDGKLVLPVETDKKTLLIDVWSISLDQYNNVAIKGKSIDGTMSPGFKHNDEFFFKGDKVLVENKYVKEQGTICMIDFKDRFYAINENGLPIVSNLFDAKLTKL